MIKRNMEITWYSTCIQPVMAISNFMRHTLLSWDIIITWDIQRGCAAIICFFFTSKRLDLDQSKYQFDQQ